MNSTQPYCGAAWKTFQEEFRNTAFGHIMITLYVLGVIFNSLNITVFTTKNAISSSNVLFTSLAIADLTVSILGVPFWWYFLRPGINQSSRSTIGHYYIITLRLFFNASVLHTATLAVWRFIAVSYPLQERKWCNLKNTYTAIAIHYTFCILYEIKTVFCFTNVADIAILKNDAASSNSITTTIHTNHTMGNNTNEKASSAETGTEGILCLVPEYIYVVFVRILPSIIILICSFRLIYVLQRSKKRRKKLMSNVQNDLANDAQKEKQMNRTTRMLLGIMILFLLDKVAGAVVKFLVIINDKEFLQDCVPVIAQMLGILGLVNVSTPFLVYFVSSQHFRNSFKSLFPTKKCVISDTDVSVQVNTESTHL